MTYPLESINSSGDGNILLIKIKIKCPARQNLEIMIFRYLKTLVFDNFFKNSNIIWCFYFWRVLLVITNPPLYDYSTLSPHINLSSHSFQEHWHDHKMFWRFHQTPSSLSLSIYIYIYTYIHIYKYIYIYIHTYISLSLYIYI